MRKILFVVGGALTSSVLWLIGCGDDTLVEGTDSGGADATTTPDAGGFEAAPFDGLSPFDATADAGSDAEGSAPAPFRLLLSYNGTKGLSQLSAFDLATGVVDGRLLYPSAFGTTAETSTTPWLLEQKSDVVARLDPYQPWSITSSWTSALDDRPDGSPSYSDPDAVVMVGSTAYVLRYNRNAIEVLDASRDVDAGGPETTIDLTSQLQAGGDGTVEMSAAWYDGQRYLWVLLANIDQQLVKPPSYEQQCSPTHPTLVAIDTTTNALASVGDGGAGYALTGYGAPFDTSFPMVYDAANARLLIAETGCYEASKDGGIGKLRGRQIEALSLADGSTKVLLTLTSNELPSSIFYVDSHHVLLQTLNASYESVTYAWDPATSQLGDPVAGAPEGFALDAKGNLVGVTDDPDAGWQVVSLNPADGGRSVLGGNPFYADAGDGGDLFRNGGFLGGVQLWPAP